MSDRLTATEAERNQLVDKEFTIDGRTFRVRWVDHHVLMATFLPVHKTEEYGANAYAWDKKNSAGYVPVEELPATREEDKGKVSLDTAISVLTGGHK